MNEKTRYLNLQLLTNAAIWRWRWLAIAAIAAPIVAVLALSIYRPDYTASSKVLIQSTAASNPVLRDLRMDWESATNGAIIQTLVSSRAFSERMLRDFGEYPLGGDEADVDVAIADFRSRVRVIEGEGGIVELQYKADSPDVAAADLQRIVDSLIQEILRPHTETLNASVGFLATQLDRMREQLTGDEELVRNFREENADMLPEVHQINLSLYLDAHRELMEDRSQLAANEQQVTLMQERLRTYYPEIQQLESELAQGREELASLSRRYAGDHPRLAGARDEVAQLESRIAAMREQATPIPLEEIERLARSGDLPSDNTALAAEVTQYRNLLDETEGLRQRIAVNETRFAELRTMVGSFVGNEQQLTELLREVDAQTAVYTRLLEQYHDAVVTRELTLQEQASDVWIMDEPSAPVVGNRPPLRMVAMAGLGGGLLLALLMIIAAEIFGRTIRLPEEASELAGVPAVAVLPLLDERTS